MNDRIQELAKQAGWNGFEALDERNEKFAQLIVQECANVCEGVTKEGEPLHLVSLGYSQNIKNHFGVE